MDVYSEQNTLSIQIRGKVHYIFSQHFLTLLKQQKRSRRKKKQLWEKKKKKKTNLAFVVGLAIRLHPHHMWCCLELGSMESIAWSAISRPSVTPDLHKLLHLFLPCPLLLILDLHKYATNSPVLAPSLSVCMWLCEWRQVSWKRSRFPPAATCSIIQNPTNTQPCHFHNARS
jgi:hypothetical protein